jgi:hypothetical protein
MNINANPYHADYAEDVRHAPFAGRQAAFGRLYAHITDPLRQGALVFVGGRRMGKTALLHAAAGVFKETTVGVYLPLREIPMNSDWMLALAEAATLETARRGHSISRVNELQPPEDSSASGVMRWFSERFLPALLAGLRGTGRQMVFMLDDADKLNAAVQSGAIPADTFGCLNDLLPQAVIALTLDAEREADLMQMGPLVTLNNVVRLQQLEPDETKWLMQEPPRGLYAVPDESATAIQRATGGAPGLAQQFGYQLFRRWEIAPELNVVTLDDVKATTPLVYEYAAPDYKLIWSKLTVNERLVLTSIAGIVRDDPLRHISAPVIENWLVDTDTPMDVTAINAATRSLEYREILQLGANGLEIKAGLMQTWLLDNARADEQLGASYRAGFSASEIPPGRVRVTRPMIAAAVLIVLVALAIAAITLTNASQNPPITPPTVTLAGAP